MKLSHTLLLALFVAFALPLNPTAHAADLSGGLLYAVPTGGHTPVIDGSLAEWDLSGAEPVWIAAQTIQGQHASFALEYDAQYLYIGAEVSLPERALHNTANPVDAFWNGDLIQFRIAADPSLPMPLPGGNSDRIAHLSIWRNTEIGKNFLQIAYGMDFHAPAVNPPGSQLAIQEHGATGYTVEARVPWTALNAPGGKNPFAPGQKMSAVLDMLWGADSARTAAFYRTNPGDFAFQHSETWGQVEFSPAGHLKPRHETLVEVLTRLTSPNLAGNAPVGVPITVYVPANGLKVSVNIVGPRGEVLRELIGGEAHFKGPLTLRWDGKDQWGHPMPPGAYHWGAYFSKGLAARFVAKVGSSGTPYDSPAGPGGWGADHSNPIDVAANTTGLYFLWPVAESGRAVVKTDYAGKVLWRKTPFAGGGFGPFYALAANSKYVFMTYADSKPQLLRLDAATGQLLTWGNDPQAGTLTPISGSEAVPVPPASSPLTASAVFGQDATPSKQPESVGIAASDREVFAAVYSQNIVQVLDPETGKPTRTLPCPGPRGVCLDRHSDLYVVSYVAGRTPRVLKFAQGRGAGVAVIAQGLSLPWDVAVDAVGRLHVSDEATQQVKTFTAGGAPLPAWGRKGGRPYAGVYDANSFLNPAGVAADARGGILVAESSLPKVMSRWDAATGRPLQHWFGMPAYWNGTWADTDDPRSVYYQLPGGFARASLAKPDTPEAYWDLPDAGRPEAGNFSDFSGGIIPSIVAAANGRKYLVSDISPNGICLIQGDRMLPVAHFKVMNKGGGEKKTPNNFVEIWQDRNGDHRIQPSEVTRLETVGGHPLPGMADWGAPSSYMAPSGDFYITTQGNSVLKFPASGFRTDGSIHWDVARAYYVVPTVLPAQGDSSYVGPRGQVGIRTDSQGNLYTALSALTPQLTPELRRTLTTQFPDVPITHWGAYETAQLRTAMHEGLGHTGESNAVKFVKYAPDGHIIWMAGRKATAAARTGEMYHFWALAGLIGDNYVAGASEWGPMYVYTQDGFFVDSLMNNPGLNPPPGPYTFGSETGSGRVQFFPKLNQVWAYAVGNAYKVDGFDRGRVLGESRVTGTVALDRVYDAADVPAAQAAPLHLAALSGSPLANPGLWSGVPVSALSRNGATLATVQLGYDAANIYARIHVADDTPLVNSADRVNTAFKGGDTAGLVLGPGHRHAQPGPGDIRLMAAMIGGRPHLVAMKAVSAQPKEPEDYFTPSGGHVRFDFVGDVPGGQVSLTPDADGKGYTASFASPRAFLELPITSGQTLLGDVEVRLSGQGQSGLQTTSRNYLFTPLTNETTMTSDVPTESRLYPEFWGAISIK